MRCRHPGRPGRAEPSAARGNHDRTAAGPGRDTPSVVPVGGDSRRGVAGVR